MAQISLILPINQKMAVNEESDLEQRIPYLLLRDTFRLSRPFLGTASESFLMRLTRKYDTGLLTLHLAASRKD